MSLALFRLILFIVGEFFKSNVPKLERWMIVLCDGFFSWVGFWVPWDGLAGFVSYCDEEVIKCVGYVLWVGDCLVVIFDDGR